MTNDQEIQQIIASFLLMARDIYDTPEEEATALIRRLKFEGWEITPREADNDDH